jgi:3D (Asp-Asp-Asp) domain-containing protein
MKASILLLLTITAYSAADHPPVGATGQPVLSGMTAAVSRDLEHLMHTWVNVGGKAVWINDRMHHRYKQRLDIALDSREEARAWGRRKVKVEVRR